MATHDYVLANQSGSSFRSDLNNALAAIVSQNSNATEPATTYAYQYWVDTSATPALIKQRNAANDAWITLAEVDGQTLAADGTNAKPGISFAADIDTGLKRNAANDLSIVTNGTQAITVDSSQNVGIGTSIPVLGTLHINQGSNGFALNLQEGSSANPKILFTNTAGNAGSAAIEGDPDSGSGFLAFTAGGSERVRILGAGGLTFNGDTATVNALDDYEEGTFDPLSGVTNLTGTTTQRAIYTKIGNLVHIDCRLNWTGSTGSAALDLNLPFTAASTGSASNTGAVFYSGTAVLSGVALSAHVGAGSSSVKFFKTSGGSFAHVNANNVNGSYNWLFSVTYQA